MTLFLPAYAFLLILMAVFALHRFWVVRLFLKYRRVSTPVPPPPKEWPLVTVQLPLFNERFVAERLIDAVCALDYPREKLEIQVLDDSLDDTTDIVEKRSALWRSRGTNIEVFRRPIRSGFKAGALAWGLQKARGSAVAIFDADFLPPGNFLTSTVPHFTDPAVGMVQTRWGHLNENASTLTRLQALFLDGHFIIEHTARFRSGAFFNFNGTGGIWRRSAIETSGGWSARTLTEDLDLSYRAQLQGWKFIYRPDVVCPAELPLDIHAFRSQQNRWSKGALQVARHLLPAIWRSPSGIGTKIEATAHLAANVGYLLTLVLALLVFPVVLLREPSGWGALRIIEFAAFSLSLCSIALFYALCQRELGRSWMAALRHVPALLGLGIGMGLANAWSVWEGLSGRPSDFIRTPKYGSVAGAPSAHAGIYANPKWTFFITQALFAAYSGAALAVAVARECWLALPFVSLFAFGFGFVAVNAFSSLSLPRFRLMRTATAAFSVALLLLTLAASAASPAPEIPFDGSFWKHWGDGKAEMAGYELVTPRYGELRRGVATAIFVTETFSNDLRVKADPKRHPPADEFPVIKLNFVKDFPTGVYDYNLMTSVFVALVPFDGRAAGYPAKISFSAQEWCGHVYEQLLFRKKGIEQTAHSYFDGEADSSGVLSAPLNAVGEDSLMLWARGLAAPFLMPGENREAPLVMSLETSRLGHKALDVKTARFSRGRSSSTVNVPAGAFRVSERTVSAGGRTWTFFVEAAFPHRIVKWTRSDGESGVLLGSERMAYWKMNGSSYVKAVEKIGFKPRSPRAP